MASYKRGFEDALELCVHIMDEKKPEEARKEILYLLSLAKEDKFNWIREQLMAIRAGSQAP
ncbi:MAG: hypothetical protein ACE5GD_10270 [Candidatus Geothermarchaeales archaeon]